MKTPEEIKKGLAMHVSSSECTHVCPYDKGYRVSHDCIDYMCKDALAYIKQLEEGIDRIYKLAKDINVPTNQPKWIGVKEMFPKHKQVVLAYVDPCLEIVQWNEADEVWEADAGWFKLDSVTHWMPLPEPPKED